MSRCFGSAAAPGVAQTTAAAHAARAALERVARRLDDVVDLRLGMHRREDGVERGGGREVDATAEEVVGERPEAVGVDGALEVAPVVEGEGVFPAAAEEEQLEH